MSSLVPLSEDQLAEVGAIFAGTTLSEGLSKVHRTIEEAADDGDRIAISRLRTEAGLPFRFYENESPGETTYGAPLWAWHRAQPVRASDDDVAEARRDHPAWAVSSEAFIPPQGTKVDYEFPSERDAQIAYRLRLRGLETTCPDCGAFVFRGWDWKFQTLGLVEKVRRGGRYLLRDGMLLYWGPAGGEVRKHECPAAQASLFGED